MARSIRLTTHVFVACLILGNLATVGFLADTTLANRSRLEALARDNSDLEQKVAPLGSLIKDIQLAVVQVQQFIQDYASTRGEDGLDDGLKEADEHADRFRSDVAAATRIAEDLRRADIVERLRAAAAAFGPYHALGEEMARAYAEKGTSAGNALMPEFDERSEALQTAVGALLTMRDEMLSTISDRVSDRIADVAAAEHRAGVIATAAVGTVTVLTVLFGILLVRRVVRPIATLAGVMRDLAGGRRGVVVPHVARGDEIGEMAQATDVFRLAIEENETLQRDRQAEAERLSAARRRDRHELADLFAERISAVVEELGTTAAAIGRDARGVDGIARTTAARADETSHAMERAGGNVAAVSDAAALLSGAVVEVERRMREAEGISDDAAGQARRTDGIVRDLADATGRIGEIVGLIDQVAAQTNLLALNATIEAARAGEAGRGFAVVATEVKQLAAQTSKATEDIARQIEEIRNVSTSAVGAIGDISATVDKVGTILRTITRAVEEQSSATHEIARSIEATSRETRGVGSAVAAIDEATDSASRAAGSMVDAADGLSLIADRLRSEATAFVTRIRA